MWSPVNIVTRVRDGRPAFHSQQSQTASGAHIAIQWALRALVPRLKQAGREADHSSPFYAEVKNAWNYTSTPPYVLMALCLFKHKGTSAWRGALAEGQLYFKSSTVPTWTSGFQRHFVR